MDSSSNYLSTPDGYATPDQIKSARDYAKALLHGNMQQPVQHWTQGVSNMVSALVGGKLDYDSAQREKAGRGEAARDRASNIPAANFPGAPVGTAPFTENSATPIRTVTGEGKPAANYDPKQTSMGTDQNNFISSIMPMAEEASKKTGIDPRVIAAQAALESGWGKSAPGNNLFGIKSHGAPDGKTMATTEVVNGQPTRTTDSFRQYASPADSVNGYVDFINTNPRYGAVKSAQGMDAQIEALGNSGYATDPQYGAKIASIARGLPAPMALSGAPDVSGVPAVQAMSAALRGGLAPAEGTQVAGPAQVASAKTQPIMPQAQRQLPDPAATPTGPVINPALIKPQPGYTPDQLQRVMANPWVPDAAKEEAYQTMLKRGQPFMMPHPSGTGQVLIDPNNPGTQQIFRDAPHWGTSKITSEGIETPTAQSLNPNGGLETFGGRPAIPGVGAPPVAPNPYGPRSEAAPAPISAPVSPAGAPPAAAAAALATAAENAPAAPGAFPDVPVQVASTDPTAGISATVGKPRVAPVTAVAENGAPSARVATDAANPLAKVMQSLPPGVSPDQVNVMRGLKEQKDADTISQHDKTNQLDVDKHAATNKLDADKALTEEAGKAAIKKYDTMSTQAQAARKLIPSLDLGLALMNDPKFNSGQLSAVQDVLNRTKALFGDKYANAPNETFDKIAAGTVLDTMKTTLAGLGQVRLAEISLLDKANANRYNTEASNRAVLEISRLGLQKIDQLDGMAQQYVSGDEVANPITGETMLKANVDANGDPIPRHGLDAGYDKIARKFTKENPSLSPDQVKNYEQLFDTGRPAGTGKTNGPPEKPVAPPISGPNAPIEPTAPAQNFAPAPTGAIEYLRKNPGTREMFEKRYGPADKYLGK